ncbi:baseplate J/gp47 family protein [Paenibacillus macerans]|uniref:baseplate J/gp47 family protein n=1 Tax=Paenibacillus macerans TaxID=44252 RepID=UPI0020425C63|nr:baseplate J/gp47 family protein [Paenibacillus macerans]MCM3701419.1 baseplate J/gp47 family protein [Paenibacillus macerans]
MYESQTYEVILQRMLDRVSNDVDKRAGSVIWDSLAPAAAELAQMYIELDVNYNLSFVDTATGDDLTRKCAEFGVNRESATKARRKGLFYASGDVPIDVPIGSRFSINDVNYVAISKITTGQWTLECEQAGTIGNQEFGALLPIDYVNNLARAELTDILVPGEDEETDDALRARYYEVVNEPAFGGNISDYKQFINAIDGVGATKVFPAWNGGGTVKCTIIGSDWNPPSAALINDVQTKVDPVPYGGKGYGTAPIGHTVTITGVTAQAINVSTTVTLEAGTTAGQVQGPIEDTIDQYLLDLRKSWATQDQIIVRVALIEAAILNVTGVIDVANTTLNGSPANITLGAEETPNLGTVVING